LTLVPAWQGILASVIVAFIVSAWLAIGSFFVRPAAENDEISVPAAILIGSGLTSFVLALFAAAALVSAGVVIVGIAASAVLIVRWRQVMKHWDSLLSPYRRATSDNILWMPALVIGTTMWFAAIAPPRSADAMRYHLAHIRQIVSEGRWVPIADYHYALPFGWSLSYLPFEMLHLPQGAQVLGLALFVVFVSTLVRALQRFEVGRAAVVMSMVLVLHPASLRLFVEASADAYALLSVLTVSVLILRLQEFTSRDAALLGFAAAIGMQSRYQLAAAAFAAAVVAFAAMRNNPARQGAFFAMFGGAVAGLLMASPFYVANELRFDNPVWPLFINVKAAGATYADTVAYTYSRSLNGSYHAKSFVEGIVALVRTRFLFPLGILIPSLIVVAALNRRTLARALALFGVIFLLEWVLIQPLLYPRFVLLMLPVAALCTGIMLGEAIESRTVFKTAVGIIASAGVILLALGAVYVNRESYRYVKSGDLAAYHRYTWFYPVYDWVNHNTPANARFLVIVSSAQTYYLDRFYRRADPWLTGEVNWHAVDTGPKLDSVMARAGYRYLIYENVNWMLYPGGAGTERAVGDAYRTGLLKKVKSFEDTLYTSRLRGSLRVTHVHVLERASASSGPR
jgi:hypothetical protein